MTIPANTVNPSDVALVDARNLALAMHYMVETGRGLTMLRGITDAELREIDDALWDKLGHDPAERVAVLIRFRCLIKVFAARRLANMLLNTGYRLLAPAVEVAASMRLNADLGFNAARFERELVAELGKAHAAPALAA